MRRERCKLTEAPHNFQGMLSGFNPSRDSGDDFGIASHGASGLENFRGRDDISALYYGFVWKSKQDDNVYTPSSARDGMARYGY